MTSKVPRPECSSSGAANDMWALGKIVSLSMRDFLTYFRCTVNFHPCLNVIMGPNGTGKSSIVCGICLALNGKAMLLGRSKDERDYITYGCDSAWLKIELHNQDGPNFCIERTISKGLPKNKWVLNGESVTANQVDQLKVQLKIQIDNLCQFLPQDRVQAFSAMSDTARLEDSINAIDPELTEKHQKLKELTGESGDFQTWKAKTDELIVKFEQERAVLEPLVDELKERKKKETRSKLLTQKKMFLLYDTELKEFEQMRQKKKELENVAAVKKENLKPIQQLIKTRKEAAIKSQSKVTNSSRNIQTCLRSQEVLSQKAEQFADSQNRILSQLEQKQKEDEKRFDVIRNLKEEIALIQHQMAQDANLSEAQMKKRIKEIESQLASVSEKEAPLADECRRREIDHSMIRTELTHLNSVLRNYENRLLEKENKLSTINQDVYRAYKYVKEHEGEFEHEFAYPMFLSLTVNDQSKASQVEMHVQTRDLFAFVFSHKSDLEKFSSMINDRMNLKVASLLAPSSDVQEKLNSEKPTQDTLNSLGCEGVLIDFIDAPNPTRAVLQSNYMFHRTPVGSRFSDEQINNLLQKFSVFYSDDRRFQCKKSKYTSEISTSEITLRECKFLKDTIDLDQKLTIQEQISSKMSQESELKLKLHEVKQQLGSLSVQRDQLNAEKVRMMQSENVRKKLETTIGLKMKKLEVLESQKVDYAELFRNSTSSFNETREQKIALLQKMESKMGDLLNEVQNGSIDSYKFEIENFCVRFCERQLKTESENNAASDNELNTISEALAEKKRKARSCWVEALKTANLEVTLREIPEDLQQKFKSYHIPEDIEAVEHELIEEAQCLDKFGLIDETVVGKYDELTKRIENLNNQKEQRSGNDEKHQQKIEKLKNEWLTKVNAFIERIDANFSRFMSEMNCNGKIELNRKDEKDFTSYGLTIKVSYRAEDKVQELKREYQSGGEKSVATMLYLLALQELSWNVPFRIVDEINQGMDADNERKVFNMIVESVTGSEKTCQYLFVTPKLLLDLGYQRNMAVLIVNNGIRNSVSAEEWRVDKFIKRHRSYAAAE